MTIFFSSEIHGYRRVAGSLLYLMTRGDHLPGKRGKVQEFDIGEGKVGEIVVCLWCAVLLQLR